MSKIGIIGWGVVGQATGKGFSKAYNVLWHDPYREGSTSIDDLVNHAEFLFVCVPTPMFSDHSGTDLSIVESVVEEFAPKISGTDKVLIIKSTVIPGTTKKFSQKYHGVVFAMNPEFLTEKQPEYDFLHPDRTLIGAFDDRVGERIKKLYEAIYEPDAKYFISDPTTVELAKFASNALLSAKIILANEIYHVAQVLGVDYDQAREMIQADPRIGGHLKVPGPDGDLGFGGKCLHPDTRVYTNGGIKLAREVEVGDAVLTIDGSWQKVSEKYEREVNEDLVLMKGQGLQDFILTGEHPIWAVKTGRKYNGIQRRKFTNYNGDLNLKWISARELQKGDFIVLPKVKNGKKNFDYDLMRLFGYYVAEGHIGVKNRITFGFHISEVNYVEDIEQILKNKLGITSYRKIDGKSLVLRCTSKELANLIEDNCGKGSEKKCLSKQLLSSDKRGLLEFMKGYFRGDGSKSTEIYSMATISQNLFYQLKLILLNLKIGFSTRIAQERTSTGGVNHKTAYFIRIRNYLDIQKFSQIIDDRIEKSLKLLRKTSFFGKDFLFVPIKEISKVGYKGKVYNFEVNNNHTYVLADAVVHNCFPKDLVGFLGLARSLNVDLSVFEEVWKKNLKLRKNQDWHKIAGAVTKMPDDINRSKRAEVGGWKVKLDV